MPPSPVGPAAGGQSLAARVAQIDAVLPQTQCGMCGHGGCLPYAQALAEGDSQINRCPPGGEAGVKALAQLTGRPVLPLDPACGQYTGLHEARIDPQRCIGCTLCIQACPVDAIVGAARQMHSVILPACTGCALCLPPCPVDCIGMLPVAAGRAWGASDAAQARVATQRRTRRLARDQQRSDARLAARAREKLEALDLEAFVQGAGEKDAGAEAQRRRSILEQALARLGAGRPAGGSK
jgi:electron transport complex protein RnfB